MPAADYLQGLAVLGVTLTATGVAAVLLYRRRLRHLSGAPLACGLATLWIAALLIAHLVPAMLGILTRESVLVAALALAAAASRLGPRGPLSPSPPPAGPPSGRLSWAIAATAAGAVLGQVLLFLVERGREPVRAFDALTFHLPGVARWIQSGTIWQLDDLHPGYAFGNYPQNGDVLQLAVMLPFENDAFVRLVGFPLLLLTGIAVYALACELRAPRASAVVFAAALIAIPVAQLPALEEAQVDPLMFAMFGCGLLFLARHARTGNRSELILAGAGLGIAFGSKWYALPYVVLTVGLWGVAWLAARRPVRQVLREGALLSGLVLAGGGVWLVRNLVESSNPLFPLKVELAGLTLFDAPRDTIREQIGFPLVHYLDSPSVFSDFVFPSWADTFQSAGALLAAGALVAGGLAVVSRRRGETTDGAPLILFSSVLALLLAGAYAATPNSALGPEGHPIHMGAAARYAVPALMLGAVSSAWAAGRLGRLRPLAELAALAATIDGLARVFDFSAIAAAWAGLAVIVLLAACVALYPRPPSLAPRRPVMAALAAAALLAAGGLTLAGYRFQAQFNDSRYRGEDPVLDRFATSAPGQQIGIAGAWSDRGVSPILPAFGPRLENQVEYVGPRVKGMLRRSRDARAFRARLRDGRYDLLVVGRGGPPARILREERWARAQGFTTVAQSERFTLLRPATSTGRSAVPQAKNPSSPGVVW